MAASLRYLSVLLPLQNKGQIEDICPNAPYKLEKKHKSKMAATKDHEAPTGDDRHYTMGNTGATTAQHHAIPVNNPGLLELISKMNLQPLFQDTGYLFNDGIIWARIPVTKTQLGRKETPTMDRPWIKLKKSY